MKRINWLVITTIAIITGAALSSCDKSDDPPISLNGRYMGSFSRTGMDTAEVALLFINNTYSGQSNRVNYPAICRGSFELDDHTIQFADSCSWTANFDWSLILSGQYSISYHDGAVRIWKTNGTVTDEYLLRPVTR